MLDHIEFLVPVVNVRVWVSQVYMECRVVFVSRIEVYCGRIPPSVLGAHVLIL